MTPERQHGKKFCLQGDCSSIQSQLYVLCLRQIFLAALGIWGLIQYKDTTQPV